MGKEHHKMSNDWSKVVYLCPRCPTGLLIACNEKQKQKILKFALGKKVNGRQNEKPKVICEICEDLMGL